MSYYCERCDRSFRTSDGLNQHLETSSRHMWYCEDCDREFNSEWGLTRHFTYSSYHYYCQFCDEHFNDEASLIKHDEYNGHAYCDYCNEAFQTEREYNQHIDDDHGYCEECDHIFNTENGLNMHLTTSARHNPRIHDCPGRGCTGSFVAYGDLTSHLESGVCPGGFNRHNVNKLAVRADTNNIVTIPDRLGYREEVHILGTWATESSWNGYQYECALCHKEFRELLSLNAHLGSPVHVEPIYRCPTAYHGCAREFKTLSGLLSHIERSECGVKRFRRQMTSALDHVTSNMTRLTVY